MPSRWLSVVEVGYEDSPVVYDVGNGAWIESDGNECDAADVYALGDIIDTYDGSVLVTVSGGRVTFGNTNNDARFVIREQDLAELLGMATSSSEATEDDASTGNVEDAPPLADFLAAAGL